MGYGGNDTVSSYICIIRICSVSNFTSRVETFSVTLLFYTCITLVLCASLQGACSA